MKTVETELDIGDRARAELADLVDLQMSPLGLAAMDALAPAPGRTILDVGCGAGQTVLQLVDRLGPAGRVIGVDIGPRVLAVAHTRTGHLPQVTLSQQDAATLALPDASVDGIYSRFGMMFFSKPVAAFGNLRRMLKPGGRIAFVCWRSMRENELDYFPLDAAGLDVAADDTPFSFEDPAFVENILLTTGFGSVVVEAFDTGVPSGDIEAMLKVTTRVGALGKILRTDPTLFSKAEPRVRTALAERARDGQATLNAATWIVTATAR